MSLSRARRSWEPRSGVTHVPGLIRHRSTRFVPSPPVTEPVTDTDTEPVTDTENQNAARFRGGVLVRNPDEVSEAASYFLPPPAGAGVGAGAGGGGFFAS